MKKISGFIWEYAGRRAKAIVTKINNDVKKSTL
jgi:hypothetical protein